MSLLKISNYSSPQLDSQFKNLAQKLSMLLATEGIRCKPYDDGLPYFSVLDDSKKAEINQHLQFTIDLCKEQMSDGYKLSDNLTFTWRVFRKLGWAPKSDLFNNITDEDVLEIYSLDNRQLYRNLRFYDYCSYSLEALHSLEWWNLWDRDAQVVEKLFETVSKIFSGEIRETVSPGVSQHVIKEKASADKLSISYEVRYISPLAYHGQTEGVIAVQRGQLIHN